VADVIDVLLRMRGTRQFVAEAGTAEAAIAGVGAAEKTSADASKKAAGTRAKGARALDKVARRAGILALGVGALSAITYKASADFERALSIFGATAGIAQKDLGGARKEAIALGNDAKLPAVTARDAADAMVELSKGGFDATESVTAARGVLLLAQAAQMDAADSTTILARTLKSFGLEADQSERVVDTIAAAALKSTVGLREIADGMSYASQTSKMMGISVEDTTASLAMLNDAGQVGAKAGAGFQIMMSRLTKTTPAATKVLKKQPLLRRAGPFRRHAQGRRRADKSA
jgi:TP901 family phage tail tape measure protein